MATNIAHEQLTKENYEKWSDCMKYYLIANDLWDIIASNIKPPNQEEAEAEFKARQKTNAAALYLLKVSCSSELFHLIKGIDSAKECWDCLARNVPKKEQKKEEEDKDEDDRFEPLWKAIDEGDSNAVKDFLKSHGEAVKQRNNKGMTALQLAVDNDKEDVVKEIVDLMSEEDFQLTDDDYDPPNPFILACHRGSLRIVDLLWTKREKFVEILCGNLLPVGWACHSRNTELIRYLYQKTPFESLPHLFSKYVLGQFIEEKLLDFALDLFIRLCAKISSDTTGGVLLLLLLQNSHLLPGHIHFSFGERWLYSGIRVKLPPHFHPQGDIHIPMMEQDCQMNTINNLIQEFVRLWRSLSSSVQQISGYKQLYDLKLTHCYANELVKLALQNIPKGSQCIESESVKEALFNAAENGIVEIFVELLKHNPDLSFIRNDEGRTVFQQAIECRQPEIFRCVYALPDELKEKALLGMDNEGNYSLDIAGKLTSQEILAQITSPALQMQNELKWLKAVASVYPYLPGASNKDIEIKKARQQFTKNHKELKDKGEKWYKEIATSSTVVGALIITIMFAAAFTVPGGNNSDTGLPIFLKEWFKVYMLKVYILADAISLFASSTSVLIFLGILTASYEEDDFLVKLPRKLIFALSSLFISITAMVICFCATVIIMVHGDLKLIIPICLLAIIPVVACISSQFPLLLDVFKSTYLKS